MGKKTKSINKIISIATKVFAEVGFAGARVDDIAKRAGVNKATIYYNIGNKEVLYSNVLKSIFELPVKEFAEIINDASGPEEKIKIYIRSIAKAIDNNPGFPNILMWEHASGGRTLPPEIILIITQMLDLLIKILGEGEKAGIFKKNNPLLIQLMIIATMTFFKTSAPIRNNNIEFPEIARTQPEKLSGSIAEELEELILNAIKH